MIKRTFYWW